MVEWFSYFHNSRYSSLLGYEMMPFSIYFAFHLTSYDLLPFFLEVPGIMTEYLSEKVTPSLLMGLFKAILFILHPTQSAYHYVTRNKKPQKITAW